MKVVILKTGEIKEVADGYARNHLLPQKLAVPATEAAMKQAETKQAEIKAAEEKKKAKEEEYLAALKDKVVEIKAKASKEGKLFAGITAADIKKALKEQLEVDFPESYFKLDPIKELGEHQVDLETDFKVKTKVSLKITNQE